MIPGILLVFFEFFLSNVFQEKLNGNRCIFPGFPRADPNRDFKKP